MKNAKPCPFCEAKDPEVLVQPGGFGGIGVVRCQSCCARGPESAGFSEKEAEQEAITLWNTRF